jgi:hypothetical protein
MVLIFYLTPYWYNIENSRFLIHDNLDSNIVWFKNLAESGHLFNHNNGIIDRTLGGLSRDYYPSDLNIRTILFWLFPSIKAYCILNIMMHLTAFLGMYLLCKDYLLAKSKNKKIFCVYIALIFALIPFWPSGALTISGQPLLLWCFFNLINKKKQNYSWIIILLFPFFSSLVLGNLFFISTGFLIYVLYCFKNSTIYWNVILALSLFTALSVIIEHRLFEQFFIHQIPLQRFYSFNNNINLKGLVGISLSQTIKGQYHFFGRVWPLIPLYILLSFFYIKSKSIKNLIFSIIILIFLLSILTTAKDLNFITDYFPFLISFNPRFIGLNNVLWYILFALSFHKFQSRPRYFKLLSYPIVIIIGVIPFFNSFKEDFQGYDGIENSFYQTYINKKSNSHQSFIEYYLIKEFEEIKSLIDVNSRICCIGINPEIAQFNQLSTLGGYYPFYPQKKCTEFNEIINNSNDFCSKRLYLKYEDINNKTKFSTFLNKNIEYLISNKAVKSNHLNFIKNINSIWIYKLTI